jgi:hypothetical protein
VPRDGKVGASLISCQGECMRFLGRLRQVDYKYFGRSDVVLNAIETCRL